MSKLRATFKFASKYFNSTDPIIVMPFGGYANEKELFAQARVLEDEGIEENEEDSKIKTLWNSYKRFESDEKSDMVVSVSWEGSKVNLISDDEGYIYLENAHQFLDTLPDTSWQPVTYRLLQKNKIIHEVTSEVMKPGIKANYGIISDMDDTIIETGVVSKLKWRVLVNSFTKTSHDRIPLDGAQEAYKLFWQGKTGRDTNPFFYLSNSPWNLFEYLSSFLENFDFPRGTLLMRDFGMGLLKKRALEEGNKYVKIAHILDTYPNLNFILVGDAGEKDLEIYLKIARDFPDRILSIYIRAVKKIKNMNKMEALKNENKDLDIVIVKEGKQMIDHAIIKGYFNDTNV